MEDIYVDLGEYLSGTDEEVANLISWHLQVAGIDEREDSDIFKTKKDENTFDDGDEVDV